MRALAALLIFAFSVTAHGGEPLKLKFTGKKLNGVPLASEAILAFQPPVTLKLLGKAVKSRTVLGNHFNGYVAQLFGAPETFVRNPENALESITHMKFAVMYLTMLRHVDKGPNYLTCLQVFRKNKIKITPQIQSYLDALFETGDLEPGMSYTVVAYNFPGNEKIFHIAPNGKATTINGDRSLIRAIFSIWLGNPVDQNAAKFKADLLKPAM